MDELNALIRQAKCYDEKAFSKIYKHFYQQVYRYIYYRTNDRNVAEDLTAETFLKVLQNIQSFRKGAKSFLPWLIKIAYSQVVEFYRNGGQNEILSLEEENSWQFGSSITSDAEDLILSRLDREDIWGAVEKLTEEQQQVIYLKFGLGLSNSEVAEILGKKEGAIKSLQVRALNSLKRCLAEVKFTKTHKPDYIFLKALRIMQEEQEEDGRV
jgi:RNA polymerase sigma-70 factor (ECF subfamily)